MIRDNGLRGNLHQVAAYEVAGVISRQEERRNTLGTRDWPSRHVISPPFGMPSVFLYLNDICLRMVEIRKLNPATTMN